MAQEQENIVNEQFIGSQKSAKKKVSVVWLNSPQDFSRAYTPKADVVKRSFLNSITDESPQVKERKKWKDSRIHDTILEKKEKFKDFFLENLKTKHNSPLSTNVRVDQANIGKVDEANIGKVDQGGHSRVTLAKDSPLCNVRVNQDKLSQEEDCFSDFEEDNVLLSMDVDAVIQQQDQDQMKNTKFHRILVESVQDLGSMQVLYNLKK
jgi:hypothetical protein